MLTADDTDSADMEKLIRGIRVIRGRPGSDEASDFEPISERMNREQMPRLAGNVFDLLA
jgi:hypothetical protein